MIAAVNGFCTAGGMEMLGGVDLRIACPEAKFAVMEPKRGLFAGGGTTVRLPRQIPWAQAMEMLLCADLIPADRAYEMGLLNAVVPREQLLDTAYGFARRITERAAGGAGHEAQRLQGLYSRRCRSESRSGEGTATPCNERADAFALLGRRGPRQSGRLRTVREREPDLVDHLPHRGREGGPHGEGKPNWQAK